MVDYAMFQLFQCLCDHSHEPHDGVGSDYDHEHEATSGDDSEALIDTDLKMETKIPFSWRGQDI